MLTLNWFGVMTTPSNAQYPAPLPLILQSHLDLAMQTYEADMANSYEATLDIQVPETFDCIPRLGVFGGTFDPIHIGHLLLAQEAAAHMKLNRVYFVPAGQPPHKPGQPITPIQHRLAMAEIATRDNSLFAVSRLDASDEKPSYTVDLIKRINQPLKVEVQVFFLMGMDSLQDLATWHQPDWLLDNCNLVALNRPSVRVDWSTLEMRFPNIQNRVTVLDMPGLDVSGMNVRERLRLHHPIRYLVPAEVSHYIQQHGLYATDCLGS